MAVVAAAVMVLATAMVGSTPASAAPDRSPKLAKLTSTPAPRISGTARVGKTLTAVKGAWKPSGVKIAYRWYRSGVIIEGATKSTYKLAAADRGERITVKTTGSSAGYRTVTKTSKPTAKVATGTLSATPTPKISGKTTVGRVLTGKPGAWKPAGTKLRYQWYRAGKAIKGGTSSKYTLVAADKGKSITLKVTGSLAGYKTVSRTSKPTAKIAGVDLTAGLPVVATYSVNSGAVADSKGNLYAASTLQTPDKGSTWGYVSDVVVKRAPSGALSVVAGDGRPGKGIPKAGKATKANFRNINAVAIDSADNLYIADCAAGVVARVTPAGTLSILAGTPGKQGVPTPGKAASSRLGCPSALAVDSAGSVYIGDHTNDVVLKVTSGGTLSVFAGKPAEDGLWEEGPATQSRITNLAGLAVDADDNLYIAEASPYNVVQRVTPEGMLTMVAGGAGYGVPKPGPALYAHLGTISDVAVDGSGNVYVAGSHGLKAGSFAVISKITPDGELSHFAGRFEKEGKPTAGKATSSPLGIGLGLGLDREGNLLVTTSHDFGVTSYLARITPGGTLAVLLGNIRKR